MSAQRRLQPAEMGNSGHLLARERKRPTNGRGMAYWGASIFRPFAAPAGALSLACLCIHLAANDHYGVFRDELYFIVCGERPAFGYVDQPPLIPLIAAGSHALFGTALTPLRLIPALAMSATVALTTKFAEALGGARFAQWLSGLAVLLSPIFLVNGLLLFTDMLQPLTWLACSWFLVRLIQTKDERAWMAFGAVVGISLTSKYLIVFYLVGLAVGVIATPLRRSLLKPWIYAGVVIAVAMTAPNFLWQAEHGWPFLELGKAGASGKNLALSPLAFMAQQALLLGPATAPLWIAGLWRLSTQPSEPELRAFPIAYVVIAIVLILAHGKAYYLAPIYPTLFAAGAGAVENWFASRSLSVGRDRHCRHSRIRDPADRLACAVPGSIRSLLRRPSTVAFDHSVRAGRAKRAATIFCGHVRVAGNGGASLGGIPSVARRHDHPGPLEIRRVD